MKGHLILALIMMLLVSAFTKVSGQHDLLYEKKELKRGEEVLLYRIMFPEGFNPSQKYPLILFLHGAGERGNDNQKQLVHGASFFGSDENRKNFPAIVIFPQCKSESYWAKVEFSMNDDGSREFYFDPSGEPTSPMQLLVLELIYHYLSEPYVDTQRVYLGGLSMGGMGTFELLYRMPEVFAAAFPICGGGNPEKISPEVKDVKIWAFHGEADQVVKVGLTLKMVEALRSVGADVRLTLYPEVGHNAWDHVFKERELLPWLFSIRR